MGRGFDAGSSLSYSVGLVCSGEKPELLLTGGETGQQINGRQRDTSLFGQQQRLHLGLDQRGQTAQPPMDGPRDLQQESKWNKDRGRERQRERDRDRETGTERPFTKLL